MKYGLLTYTYTSRDSYHSRHEVNIGDYVQSIAARQFHPHTDILVDRDSVSSYSGDPIKMIMNGWWHIYEGNEVTSDAIIPLYVSYHISNPDGITKKALEHLKKYAPIGCRDFATMNCLLDNGIKAYLSSCLTLTLGKTYYVPEEERTNSVYFVDCDIFDTQRPSKIEWCTSRKARQITRQANALPNLKQRMEELVENYAHGAIIEKRSHIYPLSLTDSERFQIAEKLLRDYSRARLVVTTRLHCALPVLSMGVPVLFVGTNLQDRRYAGTLDWVNKIGLDQKQKLVQHLFSQEHCLLSSSLSTKLARVYADQLINQCQQFFYN